MSRALVLSGGGAKGAFQAGVVASLAARGLEFDVIAGISTGALSAAVLAQGPLSAQSKRLLAFYTSIKDDGDIYKPKLLNSTLSELAAFWPNDSIYDSSPIRRLLGANVTPAALKASGKLLRVGTVDFRSGKYRTVTEQDPNAIDLIMASGSMPVFFPPPYGYYYDGGLAHTTPLGDAFAALAQLRSAPAMPRSATIADGMVSIAPDEMYIVLCDTPPFIFPTTDNLSHAAAQIERAIDLLTARIFADDLQYACLANNDALAGKAPTLTSGRSAAYVKLYVVAPATGDVLPDTLEFSPAKIRSAINAGNNAAVHDQTWLENQLKAAA